MCFFDPRVINKGARGGDWDGCRGLWKSVLLGHRRRIVSGSKVVVNAVRDDSISFPRWINFIVCSFSLGPVVATSLPLVVQFPF